MRQHRIIVVALLAAVLVIGAAGAYAYDSSRDDLIPTGVHIGTVDVGGLHAPAAETRVRESLLTPLRRPVVVRAAGRSFSLGAREARISANISAMVDRAVSRGRRGWFITRTWRGLTGGEVHADIDPDIAYSVAAVQRLVDRVRVAVSRPAVDAKVSYSPDNVSVRGSRPGRTIDAHALRATVERVLVDATATRTVAADVQAVKPKVTTGDLAPRYPVILTVDRESHRLRLFKKLNLVKTYPIAVGRVGLETPAGLYAIHSKDSNPAWHVPDSDWAGALRGKTIPAGAPNNPIKARWLGVFDGVGVHGTDDVASIGHDASHGCIRMRIPDVEALYDEVPIGTPIYID